VIIREKTGGSQERGVEGIHAKVTQSLKGGRPLSAPGLGVELKWQTIEEQLQTSPQAMGLMWSRVIGHRLLESYVVSPQKQRISKYT